ncbi:MAG: tetratricopeptide repeat protein [Desulfobacterales bacterium]|nr:tetratricopeptide repeat protein [Desulfobacterales bacterium]
MVKQVNNSLVEEENQEQWEQLLFVLENRNKSTLIVINFDCDETKKYIHEKLIRNLSQYQFHSLDLTAESIISLQRAFEKNLPESVLHSQAAEYIVNVFGLENSSFFTTKQGKVEESALIPELNFEREILFRRFPFITVLWSDAYFVRKLRKDAKDLWDWITYYFEFKEIHENKPNITEYVRVHPLSKEHHPEKIRRILHLQTKYDKLKTDDSLRERTVREKITIQKLLGHEYAELNDYEKAIQSYKTALALSHQIQVSEYERADIFLCLGETYFKNGEYKSALESYQLSLDIQEGYEKNTGTVYYQMGMVFEKQGKSNDALANYQKAMDLYEKTECDDEMGKTYQQIGGVFEAQQKWGDALENYKKAQEWYEKTENHDEMEKIYRQTEIVFEKQTKSNPYKNRGMLSYHSDMFFGRKEEMQRIESLLNSPNPECVSIVGERRIGKSSLAFRIFHDIMDSENTISVYLDCDEISERLDSKDGFFQVLNSKFLAYLEGRPDIRERMESYADNLFNSYSSFKNFVIRESRNHFKFIIFMDEFEHLPDKDFADDTFFSNLRAMANNPDNRLAYVTVSQSSLRALTHKAIKTSGFWNIFTPEMIGLLDGDSISELRRYGFEKNNVSLEQDELKMIDYYAGAFPFFNQVVCKHIFDVKIDDTALNRDTLETELFPYYEKLWENRTKSEQNLLKCLSKGDDNLSLKWMKARGILIKENDGYHLFCGFFLKLMNEHFNLGNAVIQSEKEEEFDVFLCCNSADKPAVREIGKKLMKMGISPWLDEWGLRPWQKALEKQIKNIRAAAVFVGKNGIGPWQDMEQAAFIRQFVKRGCPVIPVILSDCMEKPELPAFLEGMVYVDFRKNNPDPMMMLKWGIIGE